MAAGSAGAGAEVKFLKLNMIMESSGLKPKCYGCSGDCGKYGGVFELNVDQGVAIIAHLFDCVKFHYITVERVRHLMPM